MNMKRALSGIKACHILMLIFMLSFIAVAPPLAEAQIPRYINYQGKLTDANDDPVTGDVNVTIRIYDAESGGTALWEEIQAVTVTRGIFSMLLGNSTALSSLDFNDPYWYSVEVESDGEMTPRQRLTSVGYAINADKLDGYDASQFLRADADTSLTGALTVSGSITGSANGDVTIDPTGTGNIVMKIDSTSGDFKVTDGTTNYVLVDNATGNVTMSNDLTVSGTIYGTLASTGGNSTFSSIVVTGTSNLRGEISNSTGAVTVADALTQSGSSNQVTFGGNVDANNGLDVTGALTVSGATTLSSALDMNSNVDLDYSGTSAALDVTQASTGPAAQFAGGRVIVGANELTNANALSTGELYVLGDLEVDGTLYANVSSSGSTALGSTTLSSLTVTGTSDLQGNISSSTGTVTVADYLSVAQTDSSVSGTVVNTTIQPTYQDGGTNSTTAAIALKIAPTMNYTADTKTGSYTALKIAATETSLPTGTSYLIDAYAGSGGATQKFYVDNSGNAKIFGTLDMNSQKITGLAAPAASTDAVNKTYADAIVPASAGGWTDSGTKIYLLTSTDKVGIGTNNPGQELEVSGTVKATTLTDGTLSVTGGAVTGATGNISMWTNDAGYITDDTSVPKNNVANSGVLPFDWANDEVADDLTISGGTINNSIIGGTTASAGTFSSLALSNTGSTPTFTFTDSSGSDTLTYTSTASYPFYFSDKVSVQDILIRGSSPAVLTFGSGASSVNLIYDPATDEIRFSRGTFAQDFRNLVKNGSFESFSAMQQFHSYDTAYTTATSTATEFGGMWNKSLGFQGGWQNFAPDDWTYVSGDVFQHAPTFFQTGFTATNIDADTWKEDFTEGVSAVRMAAATSGTPPVTAPGKISQVLANLKPSAVYSVGVKMRVDTSGTAKVDIEGEEGGKPEGNTTTTLTADITATSTSLSASDVTNFPKFGTIRVTQNAKTEDIRYEGLDDTGGANKFLKCTRNASPQSFTSGATIKVTPFTALQTTTDSEYKKFEGQFATDPKASEITISLSAETGTAYFDSVQIVTGGSVPEYTPNTVVDTGDQTIYGSLRIGRSSDEKGGILSVDKFVRARGVELFTDDPGLTGAMGGGATTMGGSGVFPPGPGWNNLNGQPASTQLFVSGTYTGATSRDYKVVIGTDGTKYSWYYMDNSTGWLYQDGGIDISPLPTAEALLGGDSIAKEGIKIKFSAASGTADDTWYFHASNETAFQGNMSFVKEATYTPGKTRIYVDPDRASTYYNKLVFEDGMTKVSLADLASAVTTNTPSYIGPINRWTSNQGLLSMFALGSYVPVAPLSGNANYEITIATNGTGTATSPSNDRFKYRINSGVWSAEQQITGGQQDIGNSLFISFGDPNFNGYYLSGTPGDTWTFTAFAGSTGTGKVTSLNSKTGVVMLEQGSNVTIDSSEQGKIRISATAADGSATNEVNTSMAWNNGTNTVSVVDAGGTQSAVITGFLESEVDGSTTNELNTSASWTDDTNTFSVTDSGGAKSAAITGFLETVNASSPLSGSGTVGSPLALNLAVNSGLENSTGLRVADTLAGSGLDGGGGNALSVNVDDASIAITNDILGVKADGINDTHIDWGAGAGQVSTDDMTEGVTNLYYTDTRVDARLDTNQTIAGAWAFSPSQIIAAGSDDNLLLLTQTLNDSSAAEGNQAYAGIKYNLTETSKAGWDAVNLIDLQVGGVSKFTVNDAGIVTTGSIDAVTLDNIDSGSFLRSDTNDSVTTDVTLNIDSGATLSIDGTLDIGGTNVTSTAAELNILDGVTATANELNILDGVTSTATELNILDGVTSNATELNLLDGESD
ncbi:MAG: hypothetical protein Q7O04_00775, partial [Candidatus Omnitrophota bacterium]|nr:hypothetical protein [Candidatus Omnitrophota bacterium]